YVLEPESDNSATQGVPLIEPHNLDPARVLRLVPALGGQVRRLFVVGCEPDPSGGTEDGLPEMSAAGRAGGGEAVLRVEALVARLLCPADAARSAAPVGGANTITGKEVRTCHPYDPTT